MCSIEDEKRLQVLQQPRIMMYRRAMENERLKDAGTCKQIYGPEPVDWRRQWGDFTSARYVGTAQNCKLLKALWQTKSTKNLAGGKSKVRITDVRWCWRRQCSVKRCLKSRKIGRGITYYSADSRVPSVRNKAFCAQCSMWSGKDISMTLTTVKITLDLRFAMHCLQNSYNSNSWIVVRPFKHYLTTTFMTLWLGKSILCRFDYSAGITNICII